MKEREKNHAHATRLPTIAKNVVTTFGLIFFRLPPFATHDMELRSNNYILGQLTHSHLIPN